MLRTPLKEGAFHIAHYRKAQPIAELRRKARKSRRRQNIWTVEELDLALAEARETAQAIGWGR